MRRVHAAKEGSQPSASGARAHTDDSGGERGCSGRIASGEPQLATCHAMMDGGMALITMTDRERVCSAVMMRGVRSMWVSTVGRHHILSVQEAANAGEGSSAVRRHIRGIA